MTSTWSWESPSGCTCSTTADSSPRGVRKRYSRIRRSSRPTLAIEAGSCSGSVPDARSRLRQLCGAGGPPGCRRSDHRLRVHRGAARRLVHRAQGRGGSGAGRKRRRQDDSAPYGVGTACDPRQGESTTGAPTSRAWRPTRSQRRGLCQVPEGQTAVPRALRPGQPDGRHVGAQGLATAR